MPSNKATGIDSVFLLSSTTLCLNIYQVAKIFVVSQVTGGKCDWCFQSVNVFSGERGERGKATPQTSYLEGPGSKEKL